jgi:hypothetical protein
MTKGVVIYRGDYGNPESDYAKAQLGDVTDDAAFATFLGTLGSHTLCNVAKRSFLTVTLMTDSAPDADANVDRKAILYFRDPTTLKVHSFTIVSPVAADCEPAGQGERLTAAAVTALVAAINTATGKSYTGLYGVVVQSR